MRNNNTWAFLLAALLHQILMYRVGALCELSVPYQNALYNFSLTRPSPKHPHGILNEDGFYKVAVNETLLWFQLCDRMIFNHEPPRCFDCQDCGGPTHCGIKCSALVARKVGGYHVCTTIGQASNSHISLIDEKNPQEGVAVKMSTGGPKNTCSLTVSVSCDSNGVQGPYSLDKVGNCDYAVALRHPYGCPTVISFHGRGWGWFGTFITILLCLLGGYMLAGTVYRFFFLGIHGIEAVPNLDFWRSLPRQSQNLLGSLGRRFRRQPQGNRTTYSPVNF
ncbi:hypothetical protein AAC387_Pa01g4134 [Persea americana]